MTNQKITPVDKTRFRHLVDRGVHFRKLNRQGRPIPTPAPLHVIDDMMAQRPVPLPEIVGVAHAPFFTPAGRLVLTPGYDAETKRWLQLPESLRNLSVPSHPTVEELHQALTVVRELLRDFPFVTDADWANAFAKLLDPFTRTIHDSITPLYVHTAPSPGTGKGLLADVLTILATGLVVMRTAFIRDNVELDKRLLSLLREGIDHVHFDNFEGTLNSPTLALFLTSEMYSGRVLGQSTMPILPQRVNMSLSGNNVLIGGDMPRRVVLIQLDAGVERPHARTGFAHEDILGWALENRALLVEACLTVVQAWVSAGRPPGSVTLGSFEKWARTTSGILEHAGIAGLLANHREVDDVANVDGDAWLQWVSQWWETFGDRRVRPGELTKLLELVDTPPFYVADNATPQSLASSLGKALMQKKNRVYGGFKIRLYGTDKSSGSKLWQLEHVDDHAEEDPS